MPALCACVYLPVTAWADVLAGPSVRVQPALKLHVTVPPCAGRAVGMPVPLLPLARAGRMLGDQQ